MMKNTMVLLLLATALFVCATTLSVRGYAFQHDTKLPRSLFRTAKMEYP
jgi:hypothetical protein